MGTGCPFGQCVRQMLYVTCVLSTSHTGQMDGQHVSLTPVGESEKFVFRILAGRYARYHDILVL